MHRILIAILCFIPMLTEAGEIAIEHAWIREAPPGMRVLAGYLTVHNRGDSAVRITEFASVHFKHIEMHQSVIQNGVARMQHQACLRVEPGQSQVLAPGGYHLMLFNPIKALKAGDTVSLSMHYTEKQNGQTQTFPVVVKKATGQTHHPHH